MQVDGALDTKRLTLRLRPGARRRLRDRGRLRRTIRLRNVDELGGTSTHHRAIIRSR